MSDPSVTRPAAPNFAPRFQRKTIDFSPGSLIRTERLDAGIPLVIRPVSEEVDLVSWAESNRELIASRLLEERALLFRGFQVRTPEYFEKFAHATSSGPLLEYKDRSTPRYEVKERVYVSTVYPADQRINLHNEGTYWSNFPLKIYFCCLKPSATGGETPIADVRKVYARIDPAIREEFEAKRVMYARTYNPGIGLSWQDAFQTSSTEEVEEYGRKNDIHVEWTKDGRLVTRQVRPAVRKHPISGEPVWFNHAVFFNIWSFDVAVRDALLSSFGEEGLPYNTYYGDGTRIDPDVVAHIREAYAAEKRMFSWQADDILLLDNMSIAHAREPYTGDRHIVVAMTEAQLGGAA